LVRAVVRICARKIVPTSTVESLGVTKKIAYSGRKASMAPYEKY
jgi:hypothetical protein